jgi:hypothetical protein
VKATSAPIFSAVHSIASAIAPPPVAPPPKIAGISTSTKTVKMSSTTSQPIAM